VHPAAPYSKITNIADVGCGTGWLNPEIARVAQSLRNGSIWLEELQADELPSASQANPNKRRFDGFDISDAQFPKDGKCNYVVHDILKPFPPEYHGVYDLVHVRLMLFALKRDQFELAVKNLFKIVSELCK
jgi:hypothetical protein